MTMAESQTVTTQGHLSSSASVAEPAEAASGGSGGTGGDRQEELAEIIRAYNEVTERLQKSHEHLQAEVVRLREELASTNAQLQRSKRLSALGEMAAGIAHEIRNPLGAIQLYANMASDDLSGESPDVMPAKENLHKIASAVRGLNGIVNDVLSFARELEPTPQPIDISNQFDKALQTQGPGIEQVGVTVEREDQQRAEVPPLQADETLLQQALVNLIRNAVDAMREHADGGNGDEAVSEAEAEGTAATEASGVGTREQGQPRLILDAAPDEHGVTLTVRDTGPGIAEADIDRIFNPFFTTRGTGTGLGLAIVHRIVDAHGGTVSVHNDGGAVFQLSLPTQPPVASEARLQTETASVADNPDEGGGYE
jgi:signal transduction histidine kinase